MRDIVKLFSKYKANKFANGTELAYGDILPDSIDALLEIGIGKGGSLNAWCDFYPNASIFGIEMNEAYVSGYSGRADVYLGDVSDKEFMLEVVKAIPSLDIIIDDGSHKAKSQQDAFAVLFPKLKRNGIYVIEDLHVAFDKSYHSVGYVNTLEFLASLPYDVAFHHEHTATIRRRTND